MARILFMTSVYRYEDKGNLNVDLVDELVAQGHHVDVMTPIERKYGSRTRILSHPSLRIIEFPCLNFRGKVNLVEKGLSTLSLGHLYRHFIRTRLSGIAYDLTIFTTLPTTYTPALRYLKKRYGTYCYLLHKDIFPQSAVDLGILNRRSPIYGLFRYIEKGLYSSSDMIGVMSEKNVEYMITNNPRIDPSKVEVCPNSIKPLDARSCDQLRAERSKIRARYSIPLDSVVYLYGGNISRAQGVDFILAAAKRFEECPNSYLLFVGSGNEMERLRFEVAASGVSNVGLIDHLPKHDFDEVTAACDVGAVFLDHRFTIANIPSRTLAHLNMSQPIIAATDEFTDFREMVTQSEMGLWSPSNNVDAFLHNVRTLSADATLRSKLGRNARVYLERQASTAATYNVIASHDSMDFAPSQQPNSPLSPRSMRSQTRNA